MSSFKENVISSYWVLLGSSWFFSFVLVGEPGGLVASFKSTFCSLRWFCLLPLVVVAADPILKFYMSPTRIVKPPPEPEPIVVRQQPVVTPQVDWEIEYQRREEERMAAIEERKREKEEAEQRRIQEKQVRSAEAATQETLNEF